jgi:ribosomal protein S18 acetylase RimI-like enzyme
MTIRIATANDIESISCLYDEFYKYNHSQQPFFCAVAKESGEYPKSVIDGSTGDIFIAEIGGAIIGFIHIEEEKTPPFPSVAQHKFACIVDFYVTPDYRKRGVGKALLEQVKKWSVNRKLEYLELFVLEENKVGINFYKRENFDVASYTMRYIL